MVPMRIQSLEVEITHESERGHPAGSSIEPDQASEFSETGALLEAAAAWNAALGSGAQCAFKVRRVLSGKR